jgi:ubiquinone/menaquinone biosynthesis C-methylase UbiE
MVIRRPESSAGSAPSQLDRFVADVQKTFPALAKTLSAYLGQLRGEPGYAAAAEELVRLVFRLGECVALSYDDVLDGYADFCLTYLREQNFFLETGEYRNSSNGFEAVRCEVYENDEYMKHYMLGHMLSCAVFPHHYVQYRFFIDRFVPSISPQGTAFEFGLGHGLWLGTVLAHSPQRRGDACDISPTCIGLAEHTMRLLGISPERFRVTLADAVQFDLEGRQFDAMIASGLLEHIEDPESFLKRIRPNLRPESGRLFTMVPTNTALPDHLVLFTEVDEIRDLYRRAGFTIVEECVASAASTGDLSAGAPVPMVHLGILARPH